MPGAKPAASIPMNVRPLPDGGFALVHATTGTVISTCSSQAVAERTRDFFKP